jgi:A/G-specific adenine glycosylase
MRFTEQFPDINALANASEQEVLNLWQGLGYYSRARNLHATAKYISDELNGQFPDSFKELLKLKGVGPYTAAAISSIAFNEKAAVVDGNVYRVLSRVFNIDTPIDSTEGKKVFQNLANDLITSQDPGDHNQAIMELGATVCTPSNPDCNSCPLSDKCLALDKNTIAERPVKLGKTKKRDRHFHYLIFEQKDQTVVVKRTEKDIWQHLFQFPLLEGEASSKKVPEGYYRISETIKHLLSHQSIYARFYHYDFIPELEKDWTIISWSDMENHPVPALIDKYLESYRADN